MRLDENYEKNENNIVAIILSSLPTILQLIVAISIGLGSSMGLSDFFYFNRQITLINFLAFLLTLSVIFSYSFFRDNRKVSQDFSNPQAGTKSLLIVLQILQFILFLVLLIFTLLIVIGSGNLFLFGIFQAIAYPFLLILIGLNIYIWIQDKIEKQKHFRTEDLIPNLNTSLRRYGLLQDKNKVIHNQDLQYGNRVFGIQTETEGVFYVVTSFDAKNIYEKLSEEEFKKLFKSKNNE